LPRFYSENTLFRQINNSHFTVFLTCSHPLLHSIFDSLTYDFFTDAAPENNHPISSFYIKPFVMKKISLISSLLLVAFLSYSADSRELSNIPTRPAISFSYLNPFLFQESTAAIDIVKNGCSVTITASVGYSSTYISASCSSTKSTCQEAIVEASGCVKTAIATARKNIK
jgi:hypothetical protein